MENGDECRTCGMGGSCTECFPGVEFGEALGVVAAELLECDGIEPELEDGAKVKNPSVFCLALLSNSSLCSVMALRLVDAVFGKLGITLDIGFAVVGAVGIFMLKFEFGRQPSIHVVLVCSILW